MPEPTLAERDPAIFQLIQAEAKHEKETLRLIASENYASRAVMEATGSVLTNKYSEGYPRKRYYEGQQYIDQVEELAIARVKELFGAEHVNVQPYSGSPANLAVYAAFCQPEDTILGLALAAGGHLTHGHSVSFTGKTYKAVQYGVSKESGLIEMDEVRKIAKEQPPKLIWVGHSAYARVLDFQGFRAIADEVGALLVADIAHICGLVAGGAHPSPVGIADVITSTTHKTFRGPRGGMIMCKKEHAAAIDKAVFPGLQGGPHNHVTAGIAVAALEAQQPSFKEYARAIVDNARALAAELTQRGHKVVTGGTDNHLFLLDFSSASFSGKTVSQSLDRAGIVANANSVPFDPRKPFDPSGVRIGLAALTSRGMGADVMKALAGFIDRVAKKPGDAEIEAAVREEVRALAASYPAPGILI